MRKIVCDYCGKEIASPTLDGKWVDVKVGKPLKVSIVVYDQTIGDTDLCDICYADAVEDALDKLRRGTQLATQ